MEENNIFENKIEINVDCSKSISLLSVLDASNNFPCIRSLSISNKSDFSFEKLKLTIRFDPEIGSARSFLFNHVLPHTTLTLNPIELQNIAFSTAYFTTVHQTEQGKIIIEVFDGEDSIALKQLNMTILPYNHWGGMGDLKYSQLARFVMPDLPSVKELVVKAGDLLAKKKIGPLDGYQSDPNGVKTQMIALYKTIQSLGIHYFNPPSDFQSKGQPIRIPEEVIRGHGGTCIDMAILYASALERIGLHPIIFLLSNHAYAGCFLHEEDRLINQVDDSFSRLYGLIQQNSVIAVECTAMNVENNQDFDSAAQIANFSTIDHELDFSAVDIRYCREAGISPLPLIYDPILGQLEFKEKVDSGFNTSIITPAGSIDNSIGKETKIDVWEKELLDLTMSNPLLNMKIKSKGVPLLCSDSFDIYKLFSLDKKYTVCESPLAFGDFALSSNPDELLKMSENNSYNSKTQQFISSDMLVSLLRGKNFADRLKGLYRKSKESISEGGVNIFFITLGVLKYYEEDETNLGACRYAPIILIPAEILQGRTVNSYFVKLRDEDWLINTTLLEYIKKNSHLDVAKLFNLQADEEGRLDVPAIMHFLTKTIANKDHWVLYPNYLNLGNYDFSHYVMWNSLRLSGDKLSENPIIKSLLVGQNIGLPALNTNVPDETTMCVPLTADSSQLTAVENCSEGKSFILFGPPGTGKSQTIVNMITNLLFQGKKVLFVSEKKAALDVVYTRLKRLGLDPFCLSLHSNKVRKGDILDQLEKGIQTGETTGAPIDYKATLQAIQQSKKQIEGTIRAFATPTNYYLSINDAFLQYEKYKAYKANIPFSQDFLKSLDRSKIKLIQEALDKITYIEANGHITYFETPLKDLKGDAYGIGSQERVASELACFSSVLDHMQSVLLTLSTPDIPTLSIAQIEKLYTILKDYRSQKKPTLLFAALLNGEFASHLESIKAFGKCLQEVINENNKKFIDSIRFEIFNTNFQDAYLKYTLLTNTKNPFKHLKAFFFARGYLKKYAKVKISKKDYKELFIEGYRISSFIPELKKREEDVRKSWGSYYTTLLACDPAKFNEMIVVNTHFLSYLKTPEDFTLFKLFQNLSLSDDLMDQFFHAKEELDQCLNTMKNTIQADFSQELNAPDWLPATRIAIQNIKNHLSVLTLWGNLNKAIHHCEALGLTDFIKAYKANEISSSHLFENFLATSAYQIAINEIYEQHLDSFSGLTENEIREKYLQTYKTFKELSVAELKAKISSEIPSITSPLETGKFFGQLGYLKRTISSNGRGQSIRMILEKASTIIRKICPCFLMSPMSAASFLPLDSELFDVVIFDEASQIPTAEAVGAISRGKNLIVCGDTKQLPPTSFFKSQETNETFTENSSLASILEDCKAISLPETELKWHYRSKNESLIAFSNQEFYDSSLYTFPSFDDQTSMVKYIRLNSIYDRGETRTNPIEAQAVVNEILRIKSSSELKANSLGVVTFSIQQKNLVEDLLEDMFQKHPSIKEEDAKAKEPIFIKNIENVQGDERDIIIFSIGYGLDKNGKMGFNFGPLNGDKGYRRLNVAITRSRKEMIIFTNIDPDKINPASLDNMGAQYLIKFLQYAKNGRKALGINNNNIQKEELILASSIQSELAKRGYLVKKDIGDSKYRINLALCDKEKPEDYVLGIMIEGEKNNDYPITDKIEIQPNVLISLGWNVMTVYVYDWINTPEEVLKEIEQRYQQAKATRHPSSLLEPINQTLAEQFTQNIKTIPIDKKGDILVNYPNYLYGSKSSDFFSPDDVTQSMAHIIDCEGPISEDLLITQIMDIYSLSRMSPRIKNVLSQAFTSLSNYTTTNPDGMKFYWKSKIQPSRINTFRNDYGNRSRQLKDIAKEEFALLAYDILLKQGPMSKEDLVAALSSSHLYDSHRKQNRLGIINEEVNWMVNDRPNLFGIVGDEIEAKK